MRPHLGERVSSFPGRHEAPPLNSKRLTIVYLRTIARAMELSTKGSVTETRQMIKGKIIGSGREPRNVQVLIEEDESCAEFVFLMDMSGVFVGPELILHPHKEESAGSGAETHEQPEEGETVDESHVSHLEETLAD